MPSRPHVINLDDPAWSEAMLFLSFRGTRVPVSRARLLELLEREDAYLGLLANGSAPPPPEKAPPERRPPTTTRTRETVDPVVGATTSHASLSYRIKRIYDFSSAQQKLRPTHAGLLAEVLAGFNWELPEHPTTQLEQHLAEIATWRGVSDELKEKIRSFLEAYARATSLNRT